MYDALQQQAHALTMQDVQNARSGQCAASSGLNSGLGQWINPNSGLPQLLHNRDFKTVLEKDYDSYIKTLNEEWDKL